MKLPLLGLILLTIATGCVETRYCAINQVLKPNPQCEAPPTIRKHVYLFMMNGGDVLELGGMQTLRDKLCCAGYSKIYYAQLPDSDWFYEEMVRLRHIDPSARFVLMGYGVAAKNITKVAQLCAPWGVPIDSVVYLDPIGLNCDLAGTLPYPTLAIRSEKWKGSQHLVTQETVVAQGVSHFALPRSPITFERMLQQLALTSSQVVVPVLKLPRLPLRDEPAPTPRGIDPTTLAGPNDEWDFLKPIGSFPTLPAQAFHPWDNCPKSFLCHWPTSKTTRSITMGWNQYHHTVNNRAAIRA